MQLLFGNDHDLIVWSGMLNIFDIFEGGMFLAVENPDIVLGSFPFESMMNGKREGPDVGVCLQIKF